MAASYGARVLGEVIETSLDEVCLCAACRLAGLCAY